MSVLVVSRPDDVHGDRMIAELKSRDIDTLRISLDLLRDSSIKWRLGGELELRVGDGSGVVTHGSTVWWRRPGWVPTRDLSAEEAELVAAEGYDLLLGLLLAIRPRWVDPPAVSMLAENKLHQLACAHELGISVPATVVTNEPASIEHLASKGAVIAKAVSSGWGLAPRAAEVRPEILGSVATAPVLVQSQIASSADLRVVTVRDEAFVWRRPRKGSDPLDWRACDPAGTGFIRLRSDHAVGSEALRISSRLGITQSSQDWLETPDGPVFL